MSTSFNNFCYMDRASDIIISMNICSVLGFLKFISIDIMHISLVSPSSISSSVWMIIHTGISETSALYLHILTFEWLLFKLSLLNLPSCTLRLVFLFYFRTLPHFFSLASFSPNPISMFHLFLTYFRLVYFFHQLFL